MRDPYEILGVQRGASLDEVKAAFRRESKQRHPDMPGGSNEAFVELKTAYAFVLNELKEGFQQQQKEEPKRQQSAGTGEGAWHDVGEDASHDARRDAYWRNLYRDIDDELETLRRAAEQHDEQLRRMRSAAWRTGQHAAWAKLTWDDLFGFFRRTARSGLKGVALLFAALVGVGSVLVEANIVSVLILLGSGVGFAFSLALRSHKGGVLSAALLLFGIMTIWLPPVRSALYLYPLATISVLILLALIFKFTHAGGTVGLMTGGVLAFYIIAAIVESTSRQPGGVAILPPYIPPPMSPTAPPRPVRSPTPSATPTVALPTPQTTPAPPPAQTPTPPEPRTLLASQGAILKFVVGVPYHLKVRNGFSTSLRATQGKVALASAGDGRGECLDALEFPAEAGAGPWREIDRTLRACGGDAIMTVSAAR
jgi:hypothetical protein